MSNTLAVAQNAAMMTPERRQLLRDLVMKGASDQQVELVVNICNRYGFDPLLKHVVLISGTLYVTRDGLLDNAHRSGRFDGIEVSAEQDRNGKWLATATVWVKHMAHPIVYTAYQPEHENPQSPAWKKAPRAMTVKCAEVMALKRAFNVSLGTAEEIGQDDHATSSDVPRYESRQSERPNVEVVTDDGEIVSQDTAEPETDEAEGFTLHATKDQIAAIHMLARSLGLSRTEYEEEMYGQVAKRSAKEMTETEATKFIAALQKKLSKVQEQQPQLIES